MSGDSPSATSRKLAAIMFTDIVGYTDLMGRDEEKALALIRQNKEIQKPLIESHHGHWLKDLGDGSMVRFESALDAVNCAVEIQKSTREDFDGQLRIGIHLGDVTFEDNDVYGDGVNIASRLQEKAESGGICISESVHKAVRGRADIQSQYLGETELKNVDYPVKMYALQGSGLPEVSGDNNSSLVSQLGKRDIGRATVMYVFVALFLWKVAQIGVELLELPANITKVAILLLVAGFPFAMGLAWFYEMSPKGLVRIGSEASKNNPFSRAQRKPLTSNTYFGVIIVTIVALFLIFPGHMSIPAAGMDASQASVAILPFNNFTGKEDLDHYGFGLASEIRTQLAVNKQFDFISSMQATMVYKDSNEPPQEIGEKLGVTHILGGMYQGNENDLNVVVELVEAETGKIVWSVPYQSKYEELFTLQNSIAEKVMEKFNGKNIEKTPTDFNMEAFALTTRGFEEAHMDNRPEVQFKSNSYFEKALQLDSGYLPAWHGLIDNYAYYFFNRPNDTTVTREMIDPMIDYVKQHFEDSWRKNEILGIYAYWVKKDYDEGERLFLNVLKVNPDSPGANGLLGAIYKRKMDHAKSISYVSRAVQINSSPTSWRELGINYASNGDFENAGLAYKNAFELSNALYLPLYNHYRSQEKLADLPDYIKKRHRKRYQLDVLVKDRAYGSVLQYLDTVQTDSVFDEGDLLFAKFMTHHLIQNNDSAKHYAEAYLGLENGGPWPKIMANGILGKKVDVLEIFNVPMGQFEQDLFIQVGAKITMIFQSFFLGDFEEATKQLIALNKDYPNYGNYSFLGFPGFDRIKAEHPPFQEAIDNLKLPQLVSETNILKL